MHILFSVALPAGRMLANGTSATPYVPDSEARVVRVRIEIPEDVRGKLVSDDVYMPYI